MRVSTQMYPQSLLNQLRATTYQGKHLLGEMADGEFGGVTEVHRAGELGWRGHEANEALAEVVHVAEGTSLGAVAIYCNGLATEGLHNEVGNYSAIFRVHAGAIGVENSGDFDF